jgi:hypothetical protein
MVRDTVVANGVSLNSVNLRVLGPPPYRRQGLLSGAVDAAPLNFLQSRQAAQQGFRILAYTDHSRHCDKKDSDSPTEVYKFVKAMLKAQTVLSGQSQRRAFRFTSI